MNKQTKIYPWGHERRFNAYSTHFRKEFGGRIQKVSVNAGFTCPNRDGGIGTGGCTFCNNSAFNPSYCKPEKSVIQQIEEGIEFHAHRYKGSAGYMVYFQAYSNTYDRLEKIKVLYEEALSHEQIVGLVIGTRPDCVDEAKLDYFADLAKRTYLTLEFGIESVYEKSLQRINRGHDYETAVKAVQASAERGIRTGAHFIFGLPGESREEMLASADIVSQLPLKNIKFHQLQIVKDTAMAEEYTKYPENFEFFEMEEYIDFFVNYVERLNPDFVVERFVSEVPPPLQAGPRWGKLRNDQIINLFEKKLRERDTWQGRLFERK